MSEFLQCCKILPIGSAVLSCGGSQCIPPVRSTFSPCPRQHARNIPVSRASDVGRDPSCLGLRMYSIVVVGQEPFEAFHIGSLICASACSSQYVIPISRYIVVAVVRCSCACSLLPVRRESLPRPRWQWAMRGRSPSSP